MNTTADFFSRKRRLVRAFLATAAWIASVPLAQAAPPAFQKKLSDEGIANVCKQWGAGEVLAEHAAGKKAFAPAGGLILRVTAGSYAERYGIVVGSMMIRRGDFEFGGDRRAFEPGNRERLNRTAGELVWVTPDNEHHSAPIGEELVGVMYREERNLAAWYLRHGQRDPRWDELVVTALLSQGLNTTISESCWAAAAAKGYRPDRLLHWCGIFLSLARGDHAAADAHATAYGPIKAPAADADFPLSPLDWCAVALQTGEMTRLAQFEKGFPADLYADGRASFLGELAERFPRPAQSPVKLAEGKKRRSFLKTGTSEGPEWTRATPAMPEGHKMSGLWSKAAAASEHASPEFPPERLEAPLNHFRSGWWVPGEPAADLDVEITFKIRPHATADPVPFPRTFLFGLANNVASPQGSEVVATLLALMDFEDFGAGNDPIWAVLPSTAPGKRGGLATWNGFRPEQRHLTTLPRPAFRAGDAAHKLRVVRVGDWAEATIDGKRLALVPVPRETRHPGLFLRVVGCEVTATGLRADILE